MEEPGTTRPARRQQPTAGSSRLVAGDVVAGRYRVVGLLGRGGMGEVHEAEDRDFGIPVALKTIRPELARDEGALRDFRREVLLARQVTHRNVCRLHDLSRDAERDLVFCTMELLRGQTLSQRLDGRTPIATDEALPIVQQLAQGLDAAHAVGVVHHDLKPGNVMVVPSPREDRLVITDFGLARAQAGASDVRDETVRGTPSYMAPEQIRGERTSPATDLHALGVVLFEMVTGRLPFEGVDTGAILRRRLAEEAPAARSFAPALPDAWDEAIRRCLAREVRDRPGTAGEVVALVSGRCAATTRVTVRPHGRLPSAADTFFGRGAELDAMRHALAQGTRLLTLLGPPGTGKTRLALEHARKTQADWPGGAWFCDLAQARSLEGIASAVATALDVPLGKGDPIVQLGHAIAGRGRALLVLDNFEQVADHAAATVGHWLERAPEATFVVTSRVRLDLAGEHALDVGVLSQDEGVELFLERGRRHRPGFAPDEAEMAILRGIVQRLDGLPLAIELSAARMRVMSPRQVQERLSDRFHLLSGGPASGRHRALRAAIDSSWELLEPWEQAAFAQLSVFGGGFTLEAAEAVIDLSAWPEAPWVVDIVQSLLDKSLLRVEAVEGEPRFAMLASLREYADAKLREDGAIERAGSGALAARGAEERHGRFFARFGTQEAIEALDLHGGVARRRRLALESENAITACERAVERGDPEVAVRTLRAACAVLELRGPFSAAVTLANRVLPLAEPTPALNVRALVVSARACWRTGRMHEAREHLERALAVHRELGDRRAEGVVLGQMGGLHFEQGRMDEAREHCESALAIHRELGNWRSEGHVLGSLGLMHSAQGRMDEAREHFESALATAREVGDRGFEGIVLVNLGSLHFEQGRIDEGREHYESALAIHRELGDRRAEGVVLGHMGNLPFEQGRMDEAREHFENALAIHRGVGNRRFESFVLRSLGNLHFEQGRMDEAREKVESALAIARELGDRRFEGVLLDHMGNLHFQQGRMNDAREHHESALAIARELGDRRLEGVVLSNLGDLHREQGCLDDARMHYRNGEELLRMICDKVELGKLLCGRGELEAQAGDAAAARACLEEAESLANTVGAGPASVLGRSLQRLRDALAGGASKQAAARAHDDDPPSGQG